MGYQLTTSKFEVEFAQEHPQIFRFTEDLTSLEYVYNLIAYQVWYAKGYQDGRTTFIDALRSKPTHGMIMTNHIIRSLLPYDLQLSIQKLKMESPAFIDLKGFADAIKAIVEIFNPIAWADRWENLRHKKMINREKEKQEKCATEQKTYKTIEDKLKIMEKVRDLRGKFQSAMSDPTSNNTEAEQVDKIITRELVQTLDQLEQKGTWIKALPDTKKK